MNGYWIGILGGLIGSTLTVVVTKLLELLGKSKEHQYSLEKEFFLKKLSAAEAAMTQYTILSNALVNISILFERINNNNTEIEDYLQNNLLQQAMQQVEVANNASFIVANSITLYFDLNSQFNQNEIISSFYNVLGSLGPLSDNVEIAWQNYLKMKGTEQEKNAHELYLYSERQLEIAMQNVSKSYVAFNRELQNTMLQIRNEMRKFEY